MLTYDKNYFHPGFVKLIEKKKNTRTLLLQSCTCDTNLIDIIIHFTYDDWPNEYEDGYIKDDRRDYDSDKNIF